MSKPVPNLINKKFSRLIVISKCEKRSSDGKIMWKCRCACGNTVNVRGRSLADGNTKSCGCLQKEVVSKANTTHGMSNTVEWRTWLSIHSRCYNPNNKDSKYYGGRGIKVCWRWHCDNPKDFENFVKDMGERPEGLSLDRIHNDGDYKPSNCRWATKSEQANNTRSNKKLTHRNKTLSLSQWAKKLHVKHEAVRYWLNKGKTFSWVYNYFIKKEKAE